MSDPLTNKWTEIDKLLGKISAKEIKRRTGAKMSEAAINRRRRRLGLKSYKDSKYFQENQTTAKTKKQRAQKLSDEQLDISLRVICWPRPPGMLELIDEIKRESTIR